MKDMRCTTNNCEFHLKNKCTAAVVDISEKGVCKTKLKRNGGAYAQAVAEFELADELNPANIRDNIVQCDCKECEHNDGRCNCCAESILVGDSLIKTKCFTRKK